MVMLRGGAPPASELRAQEGSHGVVEDLQYLIGGQRPERDHDRGGNKRDEHPDRHVTAVSNQPPRQQGTQVRPYLGGGSLRCRRRGRGGVGGSVQSNAVDGHGCLLGRWERFLRDGTAGAAVERGWDEGGAGWHGIGWGSAEVVVCRTARQGDGGERWARGR